MIRFIAKLYAKLAYRWHFETDAETNECHAKLAAKNAQIKRELVEQLNKEADGLDARLKQMAEMEEKGFWECENGHEKADAFLPEHVDDPSRCLDCKAPAKFIKRDLMSGQEKYESDKGKEEAQKLLAAKRQQAEQESANVSEGEKAAQYFRGMATNSRATAEKIKHL
jgi:hypothetical protein